MRASSDIRVPVVLLLDPGLTPAAKLVAALPAAGTTAMARRTGLTRQTVLTARAQLQGQAFAPTPTVTLPAELLEETRLSPRARLLFGVLKLNQTGRFTYTSLSRLTSTTRPALKLAAGELVRLGWLRLEQAHARAPIRFALSHPGEAELEAARRRVNEAPYLSEALMREFLSLLIDSDQFEDDAAPGFLVNPLTGEHLELDRFYPPGVAFEFNGPQHYRRTERFPKDPAGQQARDYIKLGICTSHGIRLIVIHPTDLNAKAMLAKIAGSLPQRDLRNHEPLLRFLETAGRRYGTAANRGR